MTRYAIDKVLWQVSKQPKFAVDFFANPQQVIADYELNKDERRALQNGDLRAIFQLGAHPFLLYSFAIAQNGGWSFQFMNDYVAALEGLKLGDIET